jgi:DNA-binding GntR family transcriptional regulator
MGPLLRGGDMPEPESPLAQLPQAPDYLTLEDYVHQVLRAAIVRDELPVGTAITLQQLEAQLGVSRTPIRQAIRRLSESGFVSILPNRSMRIRPLRADEAHELYSIRRLLEGHAIGMSVPNMTDDDRQSVAAALEVSEAAYENADAWGILTANRAFHRALYGACGFPRLIVMIDDLVAQCERYRWTELDSGRDTPEARSQHRELARAAVAGDARRATNVLHEHLELAEQAVVSTLTERTRTVDSSRNTP